MSGDSSKPLSYVTSVQVAGTKKFIAADAFGANNPAGIKFFLGNNFKKYFLGKIEENVESATLNIHHEFMAELGAEKRVIKLAHFYELIKTQASGQEGPLLVNGHANIIASGIEDENGSLWPVNAFWRSLFFRAWFIGAFSVESTDEWPVAGYRLLSRK